MVIDGKTDDWDLSAGVWSYNNPTIVSKHSVWTHMMWDAKGVYFLARYHDESPMQNATRGKDFASSWRADCYQARVIFDDGAPDEHQMHMNLFYSTPEQKAYMLIKHGGFKAQPPLDETGKDRPDLAERFGNTMDAAGGQIAFREWDDHKGYNLEAFWPWTYCRLSGKPLSPGEQFTFGIEAMWGNRDGTSMVHRLADGIKNDRVNRIFMFRARGGWGKAVISDHGKLEVAKQQEQLQADRLKRFVNYDTTGSVAIKYDLPEAREVTIAIDNAQGLRVRNLFGQYPRQSGPITDYWDGLDDNGKPVAPGQYTATIVDHKPLELKFSNSVYNAGTPPWPTETGRKYWGSNHGNPTSIGTRGTIMLFGFAGTEGAPGLLRGDPEGLVQWTDMNETFDVTCDDKFAYALSHDSWIKQTVIRRFELATGRSQPFEDEGRSVQIALPVGYDGVTDASSIATSGGKLLVVIKGGSEKLYRLDVKTGKIEAEGEAGQLLAVTDREEALYGLLAGGSVASLDLDGKPTKPLFTAANLKAPARLALSQDKQRFAISDRGTKPGIHLRCHRQAHQDHR